MNNTSQFNRRNFLSWSGVAALTVAGVGSGAGAAFASSGAGAGPATGANAVGLPPSKLIRVEGNTGPAYFREETLREGTVIQSIGFDNVNRRLYYAQLIQGGRKLPGESAPVAGDVRDLRGDLAITEWTLGADAADGSGTGSVTGYMYLRGFGHGVSFGVEPSGSSTYLWTEVDAVQDIDDMTSRGKRLCRFKFASSATPLDATNASLQKFTPVPGSTNNTASVDPLNNRLVVRYDAGGMRYRVYDLPKARAGDFSTPLVEIAEPAIPVDVNRYGKPSFQGYAVAGSYLYMLRGNAYGKKQDHDGNAATPDIVISPPGEGNTFLASVDLNTGQLVKSFHSKAGYTLPFREPEGLAIQIPKMADPGVYRLCMGFASGVQSGQRKASVYYKDSLIQP
ncbi:teichoic acid biosynthesis protein C [Streptomyces uncialis]|uniref:phage baseplate protein n=1 Tax=Streptomyces uncialis TaxID=1048205 RepID=UPI003866209D|nr:teichoic acid biosynthesis protein C [Streptomyces uncialis]